MNVLSRLTAYASGRAPSGLRPKLPSRFEAGGYSEGGFVTEHEETAAQPGLSIPERDDLGTGQSSPVPPEPDAAQTPKNNLRSETTPSVAPPEPRLTPRRATVPPDLAALDEGRSVPGEKPDEPGPSGAPQSPTIPVIERVETRRSTDVVHHRAHSLNTTAPPDPLLPPVQHPPVDLSDPTVPDRRADAPARHGPDPRTPAEPSEITIHIGRIDLRSAAPQKPQTRERDKRQAPVTSLTDYLKGGSK